MLIHDDIFNWSGWGGKLRLGSGECRLRIFDLEKGVTKGPTPLKSVIVLVSDVPDSRMSAKSCASHVATLVAKEFKIDPHRMLWVEYYPENRYGVDNERIIPERFEVVEFTWYEDKAVKPEWRELKPPQLDEIKKLIS
ncbi:MAG: hypothetical protein KKH68_04675 [Proteobacteria bacterium]|nr:hypothetical protein [Pseudomonadota bacterium]